MFHSLASGANQRVLSSNKSRKRVLSSTIATPSKVVLIAVFMRVPTIPEKLLLLLDGSEIEELDMIYGTAAPIRMDNKLEEARRHHSKHKCKGWCYRGGNCTVDIDEVTYQLRSINCHCPPGYWGRRCELHFVARLFAPVKGQVEVEKSRVSAFAFIILMLIVTIGLIFYTYRNYGQLTGNSHQSVYNLTPSLSMAFGRLSASSSRLHQNLDGRPFKFMGRTSAYCSAMNTVIADQPLADIDSRSDDRRPSVLVQASVYVHEETSQ
uniref:EGF-like domain-containing protein n=1 Tax=Angiostrongylus cantonensis TaxID=6313 RepID=A0A0K0CXQ3_ANGCA